MKISDLQIDGFGVWSGLRVDEVAGEMTVFYGRNEAGKTTLMQFLRSVLYGFSEERRRRYLPPVFGGRPGGRLWIDSAGGEVEVRRGEGSGPDSSGEVVVISGDGSTRGGELLSVLLGPVDEPTFNNVFAVGLTEIQQLGTLNDTDAAALLYSLSSGVDRVSLVDVMRRLAEERKAILHDGELPSRLRELDAQRKGLLEDLSALELQTDRWRQLARERAALDGEIAQLETGVSEIERQARTVELALQVRDRWRARAAVIDRLESLPPAPDLPDGLLARVDGMNDHVARRRKRLDEIKSTRGGLREEAARLPINRRLWQERSRIAALGEHSGWIASLESQIERLGGEVGELHDSFQSQYEKLGTAGELPAAEALEVSQQTIDRLRGPARALKDAGRRLESAKKQHETELRKAERLSAEIEQRLVDSGFERLPSALEETGDLVTRLRRRMRLDERIEQMERQRKELDDNNDDLVEAQILPVRSLTFLGGLFVFGVLLLLCGIFGGFFMGISGGTGWLLSVVGISACVTAILWKMKLQKDVGEDLDECQSQLDRLDEQLQRAKKEREEVDDGLPQGGGPLDVRMKKAQAALERMEELAPQDSERQHAKQRSEDAEFRAAEAEEALSAAKSRWKSALAACGLPENLSPTDLKNVAHRSQRAAGTRSQMISRKDELRDRRADLEELKTRLAQVMAEVGLEASPADPRGDLRLLLATLGEQQRHVDKRRELVEQDKALKKERDSVARAAKKLLRRRAALLARHGAGSEEELREMVSLQRQTADLAREREGLTKQIRQAIAAHCEEEEIAAVLEGHGERKLEAHWNELLSRLEADRARQAELHERRGERLHELKTLAADARLDETRLALACIEEQIAAAARRWRALAVASLVLESIRKTYEVERQPDTLSEASEYLHAFTEGKYLRVWTPLDRDVLMVDDEDGLALPMELLSRGTREAVYLSLRLALVSAYARRGVQLPLVLDDVLVNFDVGRVKAAARLLRDFAQGGRQVLLFTCHEHIMKLFKKIKVEVRELPNRFDLLAHSHVKVMREPEPEQELEAPEDEAWEEAATENDEAVVEAVEEAPPEVESAAPLLDELDYEVAPAENVAVVTLPIVMDDDALEESAESIEEVEEDASDYDLAPDEAPAKTSGAAPEMAPAVVEAAEAEEESPSSDPPPHEAFFTWERPALWFSEASDAA